MYRNAEWQWNTTDGEGGLDKRPPPEVGDMYTRECFRQQQFTREGGLGGGHIEAHVAL